MSRTGRFCIALLALLGLALAGTKTAQAMSCSATISSMTINPVNVLGTGHQYTTGSLSMTCSVTLIDLIGVILANRKIAVCPGIGTGSGGATGQARKMVRVGGSEVLNYQLTSDEAGNHPWGGFTGGLLFGDPPLVIVQAPEDSTDYSESWPIYAHILPNQGTVKPGTYRSTFTGQGAAGTEIAYGWLGSLTGCSLLGTLLNRTFANFTVEAVIPKNCLLDVQNIDFGTHSLLTADIKVDGSVTATCTKDTTYAIAFETGSLPSTGRRMTNAGNFVTYALYKDAGYAQPWGIASEGYSGTGDGLPLTLPVRGLVPPQPARPPATYQDTVVVTVTY